MQKVEELDHPPVLGNTYLVNCIWTNPHRGAARWMPIYGDGHIDEIDFSFNETGNPGAHIHNDVRFFTDGDIYASKWDGIDALAQLLSQGLLPADSPVDYSFKYQERMMRREWPTALWPTSELRAKWERKFMDSKLDMACKRCPHQGANLDTVPVIDGKILCPNHRLLWDTKDGSLVPTMQNECQTKDDSLIEIHKNR